MSFPTHELSIFFQVLVFLGVFAFISIFRKRFNRQLAKIAEGLGGELKGSVIRGRRNGVDFECRYVAGGENRSEKLVVSFSVPAGKRFSLAREDGVSDFGKKLGLVRDIETQDPAFDAEFLVSCADASWAARWLQDPEARRRVREIFSPGVARVEANGHHVIITFSPFSIFQATDLSPFTKAMDRLLDLAKQWPPAPLNPEQAVPGEGRRLILCETAGALTGGFLIFALFQWFQPLDVGAMGVQSLFYSLPLAGVIALQIFHGLQKFSVSLPPARSARAAGGVFVLLPILGFGLFGCLNGLLDDAAPTAHSVQLTAIETEYEKKTAAHYAVTASWRPGRARERLRLQKEDLPRLTPGRTLITVVTKPGKFGFEWRPSRRIDAHETAGG